MKQRSLFLVVIAGGSGTRFWPKSTSKKPKQLLSFESQHSPSSSHRAPSHGSSLLAQTIQRFEKWIPPESTWVVTTRALQEAIASEIPHVHILAEPQGRNTAPCLYWAARTLAERDPDGIMVVMPADHYIAHPERFIPVVQEAVSWASKNEDLVTLGIQPSRPETGYGYLKTSVHSKAALDSHPDLKRVEAFVEKPNHQRAVEFLQDGNYLWNAGMFIWQVKTILDAFNQYMPEMQKAWNLSAGVAENAYPQMTATSIDYGIMEKAKNVVSFPLACGWDDLGSWTSLDGLADALNIRLENNVVSSGEVVSLESERNIIDVPGRLVALLGIQDLIIVEQGDALLIAQKGKAQDIRQIVEKVKKIRPDLT